MSEHEIHQKYYSREDDRGHHHDDRRTLKLVPGRPADFLGQFFVAEPVTTRYLAGTERFERPSTVLETAILPLNYVPL